MARPVCGGRFPFSVKTRKLQMPAVGRDAQHATQTSDHPSRSLLDLRYLHTNKCIIDLVLRGRPMYLCSDPPLSLPIAADKLCG